LKSGAILIELAMKVYRSADLSLLFPGAATGAAELSGHGVVSAEEET
jgi:hypothetical protein